MEGRKEGWSYALFHAIPLYETYVVISFIVLFTSITLFFLSVIPWFPYSEILTNQFMGIPFLSLSYLYLLFGIILIIVLTLIVSPVERNTERFRLDEYYSNLKTMLNNEDITDPNVCEAICASIQVDGEHDMKRIEFRRELAFSLLLFAGGMVSAFIVDSYIEDKSSVLRYEWLLGLLVLVAIVIAMLILHWLFSKQANTPFLKQSCAADLRIAFYYGKTDSDKDNNKRFRSNDSNPQHMKP